MILGEAITAANDHYYKRWGLGFTRAWDGNAEVFVWVVRIANVCDGVMKVQTNFVYAFTLSVLFKY